MATNLKIPQGIIYITLLLLVFLIFARDSLSETSDNSLCNLSNPAQLDSSASENITLEIHRIGELGASAHEMVPALFDCLEQKENWLKWSVATTLNLIVTKEEIDFLIKELASSQPYRRLMAAELLKFNRLLPDSSRAAFALRKLLSDPEKHVREAVLEALIHFRNLTDLDTIRNSQDKRDLSNIFVLERSDTKALIAAKAPQTIDMYKRAIDDRQFSFEQRSMAVAAFAQMANVEAIPVLRQYLAKHFDTSIRMAAALELAELGASISIPVLINDYANFSGYKGAGQRIQIIQLLGKLKAIEAVPLLTSALDDPYNYCSPPVPMMSCLLVRKAAKQALQQIDNKEARSALRFNFSIMPLSLKLLLVFAIGIVLVKIVSIFVKNQPSKAILKVLIGILTLLFLFRSCGFRVL